jgi:hypothetical protein
MKTSLLKKAMIMMRRYQSKKIKNQKKKKLKITPMSC